MGSYNSQYESYYSAIVNKRKNSGSYGYSHNRRQIFTFDGNYFLKRIIRDLIGVFILFVFVIGCKLIVTPQTEAAYKYSKEVLSKNFDYKSVVSTVKDFNLKAYEDKAMDWMENIKAKLTGGKTLKDKLKSDFILPVEGTIISNSGKDNREGIDIGVKEGTEVLSSYMGKVKDLGEDIRLGKYIIIDHGGGIETKYSNLKEILIKKDADVTKGEIIGKSGSAGSLEAPYLHFELLYMGGNKNPQDYMDFDKS